MVQIKVAELGVEVAERMAVELVVAKVVATVEKSVLRRYKKL
jgi:hypothetical protein